MHADVNVYLENFLASYNDYKDYWNYEDGCVLIGCIHLYQAGAGGLYRDFAMDYLRRRVDKNGDIPSYEVQQYNIDSINSGKALFFALEEEGGQRWENAINYCMRRLREHPRCNNASFWHKSIYPHQIWLDGLYMAAPFYMAWDMRFGAKAAVSDIMKQFENVRALMYNPQAGLYYHAWDELRHMPWAHPRTGCSPNFWLRSMGWYVMALVDCIDAIDEMLYEHKRRLQDLLAEAVRGLLNYLGENGLLYQIIDKGSIPGNYTETSGSAMVAYALMKGARIGALHSEKYAATGRKMLDCIIENKLTSAGDGLHLRDICLVAGLGGAQERDGSVAYYLSEPIVADDAKGVGPFMMAFAEAMRMEQPTLIRRDGQ